MFHVKQFVRRTILRVFHVKHPTLFAYAEAAEDFP
jgi:hypothetical protein